ncbi:MAG: hypothetical protein ACOX4U_01355 [Anaerovoracaceae bacterium]|jgi:acyl-CoA thioesterase FadM
MKTHSNSSLEQDFIYEVPVEVAHFNEHNMLKPHAYQMLFSSIVGEHLTMFNSNMSETMRYGLAWALISQSYEIKKPITDSMKLNAQTWFSKRRGPYFRREALFKNKQGEIMFIATSYSILLYLENRGIFRKRQTPFPMAPPHENLLMEADPTFKTKLSFSDIEERKVYNSYIDSLGHVNNCRYGEFAYDVFEESEKSRLSTLKRMDAYFISEMRNKDVFMLQKAVELPDEKRDDYRITVRGKNQTKDDIAFAMVLSF